MLANLLHYRKVPRLGAQRLGARGRIAAIAAWLVLAPHSADTSQSLQQGTLLQADRLQAQSARETAFFLAPFQGTLGFGDSAYRGVSKSWSHQILLYHLVHPFAGGLRRLRVGSSALLQCRCLNRLIFDPWEVQDDGPGKLAVVLPPHDARVQHVKKIIKSQEGKTLRIGVVDAGTEEDAVVRWQADGALKLEIPGTGAHLTAPYSDDLRPRVDLLIALPRPSNIASFLHIAAQMGVNHIILTNAAKVQADYFGSHLLRPPQKNMREALKSGLEQAGDVSLPKVHVAQRLKVFLEDDLERLCPKTIRVVAHPQKEWLPAVAVGPEAGWDDPYELELLGKHGFQGVSLGKRTLRTDVALTSLLALAHDRLRMADQQSL